jgi:hypothetical protein
MTIHFCAIALVPEIGNEGAGMAGMGNFFGF